MRDAFIAELMSIAEIDERVALLTGDLGYGVVEKFSDKFPNRFWNCGVAEQSMMSIAAGLAKSGLRPFVYSIANFPTFRCLEQIRNDVCYHDLPVTIVSVGGGLGYGTLGYTHHGIEDIAAMRALPNIHIYSPCDPVETIEVLSKIHQNGRPAYLRLGKNGEPKIKTESQNQIKGTLRELKAGKDLTILCCGSIAENCVDVANNFESEINIQVISIPQIQPLQSQMILNLVSSQKILVVEEHVERGGLGSALLEGLNKLGQSMPISHLYVKENQISQTGSQDYLRGLSSLNTTGIRSKILEIFSI